MSHAHMRTRTHMTWNRYLSLSLTHTHVHAYFQAHAYTCKKNTADENTASRKIILILEIRLLKKQVNNRKNPQKNYRQNDNTACRKFALDRQPAILTDMANT